MKMLRQLRLFGLLAVMGWSFYQPMLMLEDHCAQATNAFMQTDGANFCFGGKPVQLYGVTMYPYWQFNGQTHRSGGWRLPEFTQYIDTVLNMAQAAKINTIRPTDYLSDSKDWDDPVVWKNMDYLIERAKARNMWVILDISTFRQWEANHTMFFFYDPNDWTRFIQWVTERYRDATAVCMYSIAGEIAAEQNGGAKPLEYVNFFTAVEDMVYTGDQGHHLISAGGFSYLNFNSGIPWIVIYDLPHNHVAAVHVYSQEDRNITVPMVSAWAQEHHKPFLIEEFGFQQKLGDAARAEKFTDIYNWGRDHHAVGLVAWSLGTENAPTSYDFSDQTPLTWAAVQQHAP